MSVEKTDSCSCCGNCDKSNSEAQPKSRDRRKLLGILVGIINVGLIGAIVGPVLGFIGSPLVRQKKSAWIPLLDESDVPTDSLREVTFTARVKDGYQMVDRKYTVYLQKKPEGIVCIDPACTHLGCRVQHQAERKRFVCPCHGGVFDDQGLVVSGPPPKPLERHQVKVEHGKVLILKES